MPDLKTCIGQFTLLRRASGTVWGEVTRRKAPHKPILLMAVLDLIARGVITTPVVDVTGDLVELNDLFNLYWRRVVSVGRSSSIAFPFSRLHNEPFWKLIAKPEHAVSDAVIAKTTTVSYLRTYALGARIDEDLFAIMQTESGRTTLREALLQSCFSEEAQLALLEQAVVNQGAFDYELMLEKQAHQPLVKEVLETNSYKPAVRDQGFRRMVVSTYDHRCALCGIRIVTPEGHTVVEAAHIVPWSESRNDDIRNGMALCRLCHWGFDEGMLGVSINYQVITASSIGLAPNFAGSLQTLTGRAIIQPGDTALRPAQEYLGEHRHRWKLK
ncbi:MAG: HNH endonuclease [Trichlorobacter sp.]|uniref:HNH endonuclease n=1 Tax=Trichlorobacter sp. TaxID=2911007 RepID=UPI002563BF79|nr:HNH endonuclease [Trichlorobacter sp.]MDK9718520.1 HNH endonuclease [Trichlorobacter sp.]